MKIYLVVYILCASCWRGWSVCDSSPSAPVEGGPLGRSGLLAWLGVLRVHLRDGAKDDIAVTGVVLVHQRYALVSADDVAKIPHRIFIEDSRVMFIGVSDEPWYCGTRSYSTHPEYGITLRTIALLELDLTDIDGYPMRPICFPNGGPLDTGTSLYVAGYTDENQLLEKTIYEAQFVEKETCAEFYDRAGLNDKDRNPSHYICTYCPRDEAQCVFDKGMALVSNATKHFSLVGFGVHGPGCKAPARFIDLQPYYQWIQDSTTDKDEGIFDYRRAEKPQHIPLHDMFRFLNRSKIGDNVPQSLPMEYELYPFPTSTAGHYSIVDIDNSSFYIHKFNEKVEIYENACLEWTRLVYREYVELSTGLSDMITAYYKISLIDLETKVFTCARLSIDSESRSDATFSFKTFTEVGREGFTSEPETPGYLLKRIPQMQLFFNDTTELNENKHLTVKFLKEKGHTRKVFNYDLFVEFKFKRSAVLKLEVFSIYGIEKIKNNRRVMTPVMTEKENKSYLFRKFKISSTIKPHYKISYNNFTDVKEMKTNFDERSNVIDKTFKNVNNIDIETSKLEKGVPKFIIEAAIPMKLDKKMLKEQFDDTIPTNSYDDDYNIMFNTDSNKSITEYNKLERSIEIMDVTLNSNNNSVYGNDVVQVMCLSVCVLLINV